MSNAWYFNAIADFILTIHVLFVVFVVCGLILIYVGYFLGWRWIRNWKFRLVHVIAIATVVMQSWLGVICPLTILEMWLREKGGSATYGGSFIQHWLQTLLYYEAPAWVFIVVYSLFGALVAASWCVVRPHGKNPFRHSD